jgi:hypothetical protein
MYIFGAIILVAVAGWFAFSALDRSALQTQEGRAAVTGKEHRPPGTTYTRTIINNRTVTLPQSTAEAFVLALSIDGGDAYGFTDRELYDAIEVGDSVSVTYQRRRITGAVQVIAIRRLRPEF